MTPAAQALPASRHSSWRVSRDGAPIAVVALRREGTDIVVAADLAAAATVQPHRFETLQTAEAFVSDLVASFAYLGCDVVAAA
jgi:hypothetical protein